MKKMKKIKRIVSLIVIATMIMSTGVCFSFAGTNIIDRNSDNEMMSPSVSGWISTGYCTGDGVKFKAEPSASSTTLGLIYKGETLLLQIAPAGTPSSWVYVRRVKTGQLGYIAAQYYAESGKYSIDPTLEEK